MNEMELKAALKHLKPFQKRTVDYVFQKLFQDRSPTDRFLVADEVGLGKTLVAKGVVARTIEHLMEKNRREINIIYISSNSAIAAQNTKKLKVSDEIRCILNRRATLLPVPTGENSEDTSRREVNLISLTPGTTFKVQNSIGVKEERAFLYYLIKARISPKYHDTLSRLFQGNASDDYWVDELDVFPFREIDRNIKENFRRSVKKDAPDVILKLKELCKKYPNRRRTISAEDRKLRNKLVASLRQILADTCMKELKPSLIILDEFHRFSDLLYEDNPSSKLMKKLLNYSRYRIPSTKVLLLSATPYKMLTLSEGETESNEHFEEFKKVVIFLFGDEKGKEIADQIFKDFRLFRENLRKLPDKKSKSDAIELKERIQKSLRKVIARTERTSDAKSQDSMKPLAPDIILEPQDLAEIKPVMDIAKYLKVHRIMEYWKSSPYLLNFMLDYDLKKKLRTHANNPEKELLKAVREAAPKTLKRSKLNKYGMLHIPNARMRQLISDVFSTQLENFLWISPSMPYYSTKKVDEKIPCTKSLVFSSWRFTPAAISALLSYEAERRIKFASKKKYFEKDTTTPLNFQVKRTNGNSKAYAGLRTFLLFYPSPSLAKLADPLEVYAENSEECTLSEMNRKISSKLTPARNCLKGFVSKDESHIMSDWIMPALIDNLLDDSTSTYEWLKRKHRSIGFLSAWNHVSFRKSSDPNSGSTSGDNFHEHVNEMLRNIDNPYCNKLPVKYEAILKQVSIGSPAVCALRALKRITQNSSWNDCNLLTGAAKIALGFRILFNQRETREIINVQKKGTYMESVLDYCVNHNLQSVLDEYVHYLYSELNLEDKSDDIRIKEVSNAIAAVLATNPSQIEIDSISASGRQYELSKKKINMRGRFAMRLSEKESDTKKSRIDSIRSAFNSPFKPFVLSTTSIGQEGLDFHPYCYRIYHWNLPKNPVELEQREGRIHRYKNHVVRLNLAENYAQTIKGSKDAKNENVNGQSNPWDLMFSLADEEYGDDKMSKLKPFWTLEGSAKVEQNVLMLLLSKENQRFERLKRSRQVYRLTFGHQDQNELLEYLCNLSDSDLSEQDIADLQINLEP